MERASGSIYTPKVECINPVKGVWRVRFDYAPAPLNLPAGGTLNDPAPAPDKSGQAPPQGDGVVSWWEWDFDHKPAIAEIKAVIIAHSNKEIDERILSGFRFEGVPVWLSAENQFNYKAAFDLAMMTQGATLPVTFKFGTDDAPVYRKFETVEDIQNFYTQALAYVNGTLAAGWAVKDGINWGEYNVPM